MPANFLTITAIPAFTDNYIWAISKQNNQYLALVDPGDPHVCIDYITKNKLQLCAILITHHHHDHTGGIEVLRQFCHKNNMPLTIYGPRNEVIPYCDIPLSQQDSFKIAALETQFSVIDLPGHTAGHIAYYTGENLFCGDTLFSAGCGRVFDGSASQLHHSLAKLKTLPDHTKVYCTHEYTQANINFAVAVDPNNQALSKYAQEVKILRENNKSTLPSSIGLEKKINPFLRCDSKNVISSVMNYQALNSSTIDWEVQNNFKEVDVFTTLRLWKDKF